jgi:hypothetical protein
MCRSPPLPYPSLPFAGGPLLDLSECQAAGRFPPLLSALGEHVRTHHEFFKVPGCCVRRGGLFFDSSYGSHNMPYVSRTAVTCTAAPLLPPYLKPPADATSHSHLPLSLLPPLPSHHYPHRCTSTSGPVRAPWTTSSSATCREAMQQRRWGVLRGSTRPAFLMVLLCTAERCCKKAVTSCVTLHVCLLCRVWPPRLRGTTTCRWVAGSTTCQGGSHVGS